MSKLGFFLVNLAAVATVLGIALGILHSGIALLLTIVIVIALIRTQPYQEETN